MQELAGSIGIPQLKTTSTNTIKPFRDNMDIDYSSFLSCQSSSQWKKVGINRRAGIIAPLFSLYSKQSIGIGELPDLKLLVDWCKSVGFSIIQLLPMNDVGFEFRPYDAQSTFALDPMYLALDQLVNFEINPFKGQIESLRKRGLPLGARVDYGIKKAKLDLLWSMFQKRERNNSTRFRKFRSTNSYWLEDYALFKVIKETQDNRSWQEWLDDLRLRKQDVLQQFEAEYDERVEFHKWLQWQLFEQFQTVKDYAFSQGILIMGDLPFLVSRDSADVWAHQNYFKLDLSAGAPPDLYFSTGQRWGMPPYRWDEIESHNYDYLIQKLKYAENFYDLFRIDHFVGIFRIWTIKLTEPLENAGLHGVFDPHDEQIWETQGRKLVSEMLKNASMLPCAEDLGIIPECSYRLLREFGLPGIDVQRWTRDWGQTYDFKSGEKYRKNAVNTISTHDMLPLVGWWLYEAGTVDEELFKRLCRVKNIDFDNIKNQLFDLENSQYKRLRWKSEIASVEILLTIIQRKWDETWEIVDLYKSSFDEREKFWNYLSFKNKPSNDYMPLLVKQALLNAQASASIFSIQLLQDWFSLDDSLSKIDPLKLRVNYPGTISDENWSIRFPFPLEDFKNLKINKTIRDINRQSGRY